MVYSQVSFANTHNLVLTAVHSLNALKDSMLAIMESYEVTPHKIRPVLYEYTYKLCNPLAKVSLLMLYNRQSSNSFSNNVLVTD